MSGLNLEEVGCQEGWLQLDSSALRHGLGDPFTLRGWFWGL